MNQKGLTLLEVMIASIILIIFVTAFYKIFFRTEKFERMTETKFNAYNLAAGIMNNFARYQGTGIGRDASFAKLSDVDEVFQPGVLHNIVSIDGTESDLLNDFIIDPADYIVKGDIIPSVEYEIDDYTTDVNNTYAPSSGPGQKDGFRMVKVRVAWEDTTLEQL